MAVVKGTNSYATVEEANAYFADRLDVAAWTEADPIQKGQALVTATSILDNMNWIGTAVSDSQPLAFPRNGSYFDPRLGIPVVLEDDTIPKRIIDATFELAYHLLNNDGLQDDTGGVKSISVGPIKLDYIRNANKMPSVITRVIKPLTANSGSKVWWRAN